MGTQHKRYNMQVWMASNGTYTFPLPTAYGHASSDIFVLDSLSCFYTASGGASTAAYGGIMKSWVGVNGTGTATNGVFSQTTVVSYYPTAASSGVNMGGFVWESVDGIPMWYAPGTAGASNPGIASTAYTLHHMFTGAFATGNPAVEVFASFHYENPSERR